MKIWLSSALGGLGAMASGGVFVYVLEHNSPFWPMGPILIVTMLLAALGNAALVDAVEQSCQQKERNAKG